MIIKAKDIRTQLRSIWPKLRHIWCDDSIYETLTMDDVWTVLEDSNVETHLFINSKHECEEYALFLMCDFKTANINSDDVKYSWAFGVARARKHRGIIGAHKLNIFITNGKICLLEPQTDEYWEADPKEDEIYFVDFN